MLRNFNGFSVLYLIVARGQSKGVPRKNLAQIAGRSLIAYKAIAAKKAASCTRLIISSDDAEMQAEAKRFGAEVPFTRPAELASDTATSEAVVLHAMEWARAQGQTYDAIMLLEPSSPFATAAHFDDAVELMRKKQASIVVGMRETEVSTHFIGAMDSDGNIGGIVKKINALRHLRRQDQPQEVTMNGAFYLIDWKYFEQARKIYADEQKSYGILMPPEYSLEIETPADLAFGQFMAEHKLIDLTPWAEGS